MQKLENLGIIELLCCSIGNPSEARPRCQNGTPRVRHGVALLLRGVATVHSEQIFGFLFLNTSYSYTDSLRTLIND